MQTIQYGYRLPEPADKTFWDTYNFDIQRLATHDHDGLNSALLGPGHFEPSYIFIEPGDWNGPVDEVYTSDPIGIPPNVTWVDTEPCPLIVKGFNDANEAVNIDFFRVDNNNLAVRQKTNQGLTVALY